MVFYVFIKRVLSTEAQSGKRLLPLGLRALLKRVSSGWGKTASPILYYFFMKFEIWEN